MPHSLSEKTRIGFSDRRSHAILHLPPRVPNARRTVPSLISNRSRVTPMSRHDDRRAHKRQRGAENTDFISHFPPIRDGPCTCASPPAKTQIFLLVFVGFPSRGATHLRPPTALIA